MDRRLASDAINLGCGSEMIKTPAGNWDGSMKGWLPGDKDRGEPGQFVHMVNKWGPNQDGCNPQILDDYTNTLAGVFYKDCQAAQIHIIDECMSPRLGCLFWLPVFV